MKYLLKKDLYPYYTIKKAKSKSKGVIFFIHGYAGTSEYHNYFSDLVDDYDYYAVELPGHGITPLRDKKQLNPYSYALEIVELIKKIKLKEFILMGHSMGGGIAVMVSQMIPELIKKMIIVTPMNSKGTLKPSHVFDFLFRFQPTTPKEVERFYKIVMYDYEVGKEKLTEKETDLIIKQEIENKENFDILKFRIASLDNMIKLNRYETHIKVPTLLLVGKGDGCIDPKWTKLNFKIKNKDIKIYEFAKSGHAPFLEQTDEYYKVVMDFIEEK